MQVDEKMIPEEAVEAAARAIVESLRTARLTMESEDGYKPEARAAILAMLEAWPGVNTDAVRCGTIILHLPKENPDAEA